MNAYGVNRGVEEGVKFAYLNEKKMFLFSLSPRPSMMAMHNDELERKKTRRFFNTLSLSVLFTYCLYIFSLSLSALPVTILSYHLVIWRAIYFVENTSAGVAFGKVEFIQIINQNRKKNCVCRADSNVDVNPMMLRKRNQSV